MVLQNILEHQQEQEQEHAPTTPFTTTTAFRNYAKPFSVVNDDTPLARNLRAVQIAKQRFTMRSPARDQPFIPAIPKEETPCEIPKVDTFHSMLQASTFPMTEPTKLDLCPACSLPLQYTDLPVITRPSPGQTTRVILCQSSSASDRSTLTTEHWRSFQQNENDIHVKMYHPKIQKSASAGCDFLRPLHSVLEEFVSGYCDPLCSGEERQDTDTMDDNQRITHRIIPPYCASCGAYIINESPEPIQELALNNLSSWLAATDSYDEGRPGKGRINVILDNESGVNSVVGRIPEDRFASLQSGEPLQWNQLIKDTTGVKCPAWSRTNEIVPTESRTRLMTNPKSPVRSAMSPRSRRYRLMMEENEAEQRQIGEVMVVELGQTHTLNAHESQSVPPELVESPLWEARVQNNTLLILPDSLEPDDSTPWEIVADESPTMRQPWDMDRKEALETVLEIRENLPASDSADRDTCRENGHSMEASSVWQSVSSGSHSVRNEEMHQTISTFAGDTLTLEAVHQKSPDIRQSIPSSPRLIALEQPSVYVPKTTNIVQATGADHFSKSLEIVLCSTVEEEMMIISRYEEKRQIATKAIGRKLMEDYVLTQDQCEQCQMPLMERHGFYECVVCPLVSKKAKKRASQKRNGILISPRSDGFESGYESSSPVRHRLPDEHFSVTRSLAIDAQSTVPNTPTAFSDGALDRQNTTYPSETIDNAIYSRRLDQHRNSYPSSVQQALESKHADRTVAFVTTPTGPSTDKKYVIGSKQVPVHSTGHTEDEVTSSHMSKSIEALKASSGDSVVAPMQGCVVETVLSSSSSVESCVMEACEDELKETKPSLFPEVSFEQAEKMSRFGTLPSQLEVIDLNSPSSRVENNVDSRSTTDVDDNAAECARTSRTNFTHSCSKQKYDMGQASQEVYNRLLQGWLLRNESCDQCLAPMMQSATTHEIECVFCGKIGRGPLSQVDKTRLDERVNRNPVLSSETFSECGVPRNDVTPIFFPQEEERITPLTTLDYPVDQSLSHEHVNVVGFPSDGKASYQQEAQYLVIPDDFDFDDSNAVMKLLSEAKKNHRSHSRTRLRSNPISYRMEGHFEPDPEEPVICSSHDKEMHRDQNRFPDSSTDRISDKQGYSTAWLQDQWLPEVAEKGSTRLPHAHVDIPQSDVEYMLHDLPSSFDRLTATTSLTSKVESFRQGEVHFFQSEPIVKDLVREAMPRWEDYVNDMDILYQEPTGLTLQYMHKNDSYDPGPDPHGDLGQPVSESNHENASSLYTMQLSSCDSTSLEIKAETNTQSDDDLFFEIMQDTKGVGLEFGRCESNVIVTPSKLRGVTTLTTTQKPFSPQHSGKPVSTLRADKLAEETLKQFQMELIIPPVDPLYSFNDENKNVIVSPTFCHSCGNAHQLSLSSTAIVCGTFNCSLFMIPDDAVAAFANASRQHLSEVNEYSEVSLNSRNSVSPYQQYEAGLSTPSRDEAPFNHHRDFDELWKNGSCPSVGINTSFDGEKMTAVLSRMSSLNKWVDSPEQEYRPDPVDEEEVDLEMLIKRLTSAAKAIQDLEDTVNDVESPRTYYHHMPPM